MGTRINVLLDHRVSDFRNRTAVLGLLKSAVPDALAVRDYWISVDPACSQETCTWSAFPEREIPGRDFLLYNGPGMFLQFSQVAAIIRTGGRWCGFLVIEPLRRVHMEAFKSIARALGATKLALFADNDEVYEGFSAGRTHDECVEIMRKIWGPPQPSLEEIDRKIMAEAEHAVPQVWFSESLASA